MALKHAIGLLAAAALAASTTAAAAPGNGRIAYEANGSVYTVSPDGGAPTLLQSGFLPAFSPDGSRIAFAQAVPGADVKIFVADPDGSHAVAIGTDRAPHALVWSPDGTRLAFVSGDYQSGYRVVVVRADGSGSSTVSLDASVVSPPSWSPDGTELAFATTNDTDIAAAKADGSGRRLLVQDSTQDTAPSWSPDGSQIAFFRDLYGRYVLYSIRPDGSGLHQLGQTQADPLAPPQWSPDGSRIVFGGREIAGYSRYGYYYRSNVYVIGADGAGERRLTDSPFLSAGSTPSWSPDGTRIAFLTSRGLGVQGQQLFTMNSDGTCETQLANPGGAIWQPSWQSLPGVPATDPLKCAALSITGALDVSRDAPALDDDRVYIYRGVIANNGNVTSDAIHFFTAAEDPFWFISETVSSGNCSIQRDVSCTVPPLPPQGTVNVELRFHVFDTGTFGLETQVEPTGSTPDGDTSDNLDEPYRHFPFCEISTQHGSTIRAPGAPDLICGTVGRDKIFAGNGSDRVMAGFGHDVVHGGGDRDWLFGGGGSDYLYGDSGTDRLHGEEGDDVLSGGRGDDQLWGDAGGDFLRGGPGVDQFYAGYGNDVIDARDGVRDHVYCGEGKDIVKADLRDVVSDCEVVVRALARR
jgi:Tol biopolymer transport system component